MTDGRSPADAPAATTTVAGLAAGHADRSRSPVETMDEVLSTIDRLDGELGAWQALYADDARKLAAGAAEAIAAGHRSGLFHGMPFALKDIVDVDGRVTTAGSAALAERISPATALIGRRLMAAGGVLVGKTKTVELALGGWGTNKHMGMPRNPWDADVERIPGGSSSGSGVAVASGMVPCAIGTDTGGSVRLPASFCGIVGLKTTEGLLPTDGIVPLSHTLDTPGPMARTVEDVALMFDVLTGRNPIDIDDDHRHCRGLYRTLEQGVRGMRFGALADAERSVVAADVLEQYDRSLAVLSDLGAEIEVFETPLRFDGMKESTFVIVTAEAWHHHGHLFGDPDAPLDSDVRARGIVGQEVTAADYIAAHRQRDRDQAAFVEAMGRLDAMLTPTTPTTAPPAAGIDEETTPAHFTRAGNYLGLCGLNVPTGLTAEGLPAGLQILGRGFDEATVLRVGAAFEAARGPLPTPPLS